MRGGRLYVKVVSLCDRKSTQNEGGRLSVQALSLCGGRSTQNEGWEDVRESREFMRQEKHAE